MGFAEINPLAVDGYKFGHIERITINKDYNDCHTVPIICIFEQEGRKTIHGVDDYGRGHYMVITCPLESTLYLNGGLTNV